MKKLLKWILLFGPLLGWLALTGSCLFKDYRTDRILHNADGLTWHHGSQRIVVDIEETFSGETTTFRVHIRQGDRSLHETAMTVDNDMWGGGFVKAVQADTDEDLEIVLWGRRETGRVLDHQNGRIVETPFDQAGNRYASWPKDGMTITTIKSFR